MYKAARIAQALSAVAVLATVAGCAHMESGSSDQSARSYEFSSFSREHHGDKRPASLVDALAAKLERPSLVGALATQPRASECRSDPVFLRYHLQAVYDQLDAADLNPDTVNLRREDEFIVLDIPMVEAASRPHREFATRLQQLASVVREENHVGLFVAQHGAGTMPVRWGEEYITQRRVRQLLVEHGVEPHRVSQLAIEDVSASPTEAFLRVKLCYR